jgi:hypothetical protein
MCVNVPFTQVSIDRTWLASQLHRIGAMFARDLATIERVYNLRLSSQGRIQTAGIPSVSV